MSTHCFLSEDAFKMKQTVSVTIGPFWIKVKVKVAQFCPTLCDPMDCSLPGSSHWWYFPGKNTGVGCYFLLLGNRTRAQGPPLFRLKSKGRAGVSPRTEATSVKSSEM